MQPAGKIGLENPGLKRTPTQRHESDAALAADYKFSPVAQLTLDRNGCIRGINIAAAVLLKGESSQLTHIPFVAFVDKSCCRLFLDHVTQATTGTKKICTRLALSSATRAVGPVELQSTSSIDIATGQSFCRTAIVTLSSTGHPTAQVELGVQHGRQQWFELLLTNNSMATAIISAETGLFLETNEIFCRLVARRQEMIVGQPLSAIRLLAPSGNQNDFVNRVSQIDNREYEARLVRPDGSELDVLVSTKPIMSGSDHCVLLMIQDLTDLRRLRKDVIAISEEEQRRFGRDLHDSHCQDLTAIAFFAETIAAGLATRDEEAATQIRSLVEMVQRSAENVHALAAGLDSQHIQDLGLAVALRELASRITRRFGLTCTADVDRELDGRIFVQGIHVFRIAQEAVSNAARHSHARTITLELRLAGDTGILIIKDDGIGFFAGKTPSGLGLRTMQYRASIVNGALRIDSKPGAGTVVTCSFPALME
ncbi:MAG: PAS domain-containing protein [Verrucomicrobia bacterium]|nr:PAS domain-containing protein [Verrucomicrobiota bacterium]